MKRVILCVFAIIGLISSIPAQSLEVSIRFYDKRVYYSDGKYGPVLVQASITNRGASPQLFRLADERIFSIDFEAKTLSNLPLSRPASLDRKRSQHQPLYVRDVHLAPGESLSFIEDLRDYLDLSSPGAYIVSAHFYPNLLRSTSNTVSTSIQNIEVLYSEPIALSIYAPPIQQEDGLPLQLDMETGAILVRQELPPDQIVEYMLHARQKSEWEKFFLYLDLEEMLKRDGARRRAWLAASEEDRQRMLVRYKDDLKNAWLDREISTIPISFSILSTSYNQEKGTVTVLQKFDQTTFIQLKEYTYSLHRSDNIWTISDYTVKNLGTE